MWHSRHTTQLMFFWGGSNILFWRNGTHFHYFGCTKRSRPTFCVEKCISTEENKNILDNEYFIYPLTFAQKLCIVQKYGKRFCYLHWWTVFRVKKCAQESILTKMVIFTRKEELMCFVWPKFRNWWGQFWRSREEYTNGRKCY